MPSVLSWTVRAWTVISLPRTCLAAEERSRVSGDSEPAPAPPTLAVALGSWSTRDDDARAEDDTDVIPVVVPVGTVELSPNSGGPGPGDRRVNEENDGIALKRGAGTSMGRAASAPDEVYSQWVDPGASPFSDAASSESDVYSAIRRVNVFLRRVRRECCVAACLTFLLTLLRG